MMMITDTVDRNRSIALSTGPTDDRSPRVGHGRTRSDDALPNGQKPRRRDYAPAKVRAATLAFSPPSWRTGRYRSFIFITASNGNEQTGLTRFAVALALLTDAMRARHRRGSWEPCTRYQRDKGERTQKCSRRERFPFLRSLIPGAASFPCSVFLFPANRSFRSVPL
jgi:hypothetical protein